MGKGDIRYESKVAKAKERKAEVNNDSRSKLDEEALIGLQHFENSGALEAKLQTSMITLCRLVFALKQLKIT